MRTPRPGPGNGWRYTISRGRPSSTPRRRTSSLNSSRSGSTSFRFMCSGRPPTLWCDLMTCALPVLRAGRLDDVRIDRALREELHAVELVRLPRRTPRRTVRPMILRLASGSVDALRAPRGSARSASTRITRTPRCCGERRHDLVAFVEAQQAVIDEHADELLADRPVQQRGDHGGIDAAGQAEQHLARADLRAHARDRILDDVADAPQRLAAADLAHEALQDARALRRVRDLGMELHAVEAPRARRPCRRGASWPWTAMSTEAGRQRVDAVAVAHPHIEQPRGRRRRDDPRCRRAAASAPRDA